VRLVWHIVRKDVRRTALPALLWLGFILVTALWFARTSPTVHGHAGSEINAWVSLLSIWTGLLGAIQFVTGYVFAGSLVLEDPAIGSGVFWMTRPTGRLRMVAAKLSAAVLLFVVAPVALLISIWLMSGASGNETLLAARECAVWSAAGTLVAIAVASLACNLAQFLLGTVALFVAFNACMLVTALPLFSQNAPASPWEWRALFMAVVVPVMLAVVVHQFLTRKTARSWMMIAVALVVGGVTRTVWPEVFSKRTETEKPRAAFVEHPEDRAANIVVPSSFVKWSRTSQGSANVAIMAPWSREAFYAPTVARGLDGRVATEPFWNWGEDACRRAMGLDPGEGPLKWQLALASNRPGESVTDDPHFIGSLEIWVARARVVGEVPLQPGVKMTSDPNQLRIAALTRTGDRLDEIFIEEREAASGSAKRDRWARDLFRHESYVNLYFVVDRAARHAVQVSDSAAGAVELHARRIAFRRLHVSGEREWRDAMLVKVRIERDHRFQRAVEIRGVTFLREEVRP
jgi:hypothetical protein